MLRAPNPEMVSESKRAGPAGWDVPPLADDAAEAVAALVALVERDFDEGGAAHAVSS